MSAAKVKIQRGEYRVFTDPQDYKEQASLLRQANFRWNGVFGGRYWSSNDLFSIALLWNHPQFEFEASVIDTAGEILEKIYNRLKASATTHSDYKSPVPAGLEYLPFQKAGIEFFEDTHNILIGDEMGLGKTIQAIGILNNHPEYKRVLVVCPSSLKKNWENELRKWLVKKYSIGVATPAGLPKYSKIVIINYDLLHKYKKNLIAKKWDLVIADESHYMKNPSAKRTRTGREIIKGIENKVFLSGTPFPNNPAELFDQLSMLDPASWNSRTSFEARYSGYDSKRAHIELNKRLRSSVMIRRLKRDVLAMLPPKVRQIVELDPSTPDLARALDIERLALEKYADAWSLVQDHYDGEYDKQIGKISLKAPAIAFEEIARIRHDTAVIKAPFVARHAKEVLEFGAEKLVVFAHHHDVIDIMISELAKYNPVVVTGKTKMADRQDLVDKFQNDPKTRVFIGSLRAASLGFTLTAGNAAVFAELDWSPGVVTQAEDRLHRIGQEDSVHIQHVVINESIDSKLADKLVTKQRIITNSLDGRVNKQEQDTLVIGGEAAKEILKQTFDKREVSRSSGVRERAEQARKNLRDRKKVTEAARATNSRQGKAVVEALKKMIQVDGDYASSLNGVGFNKNDTDFGHSLWKGYQRWGTLSPKQVSAASRLLKKYHRQLPVDILRRL